MRGRKKFRRKLDIVFAVAEEAPADREIALIGKWELLEEEVEEGDDDFGAFSPYLEFCEDGTMRDPISESEGLNPSWKAKDGLLTMSVSQSVGIPDSETGITEMVEVTYIAECDYYVSETTLTLSNARATMTANGETSSHKSDKRASYKKVEAWDSEKTVKINPNPEIHLQCINAECGEVLVKLYNDFTDAEKQKLTSGFMPPQPGQPQPPRLLCETCQSVMGRQIQCPYEDCKQWYLDPLEVNFNNRHRICPHCERDMNAYWEQKLREQEQKKK